MQKIIADFNRRINLPGIGPCPRPVDIDQSVTGFKNLVSLRVYSFGDGDVINGESEEDEVFIVLLRGQASFRIAGHHSAEFELSPDGTRAIYMPPGHHYKLEPQGGADIAYVRARSGTVRKPEGFASQSGHVIIEGNAERLEARLVHLKGRDPVAIETRAGAGVERLAHFLGRAQIVAQTDFRISEWDTLALDQSEVVEVQAVDGPIELLIVAAGPG